MTGTGFHLPGKASSRSHLLLALCIWLILAPLSLLPGFQLLENHFYDVLSTLSPPVPETTPVILVGIDEPSFAELGMQWPWPREIHGELIDSLSAAGASAIALDIVFAEPSAQESDQALAAAIRRAGNVLLAADLAVEETAYVSQLIRVEPLPVFQDAGAKSGLAAVSLDKDGVMRKLPLYEDGFAVTALRTWQQANGLSPNNDPANNRLLQFFGPSRSYPYVSYYQALHPDTFLPPDIFKNRIVIVGRSVKTTPDPSARQADTFATPFTLLTGDLMNGIEVHATILDNLRLGIPVKPAPGFMPPVVLALIILLSIFIFRKWHPWLGGITALILMVLIMAGSFALLRLAQIWLAPPLFLGGVLLSYGGEGGMAYLRERLGRRRIKQAFDRYLPPVLVDRLASDP
jgi:adenylate cyclase